MSHRPLTHVHFDKGYGAVARQYRRCHVYRAWGQVPHLVNHSLADVYGARIKATVRGMSPEEAREAIEVLAEVARTELELAMTLRVPRSNLGWSFPKRP